MLSDPLFLIALGGMVLAVVVLAFAMGRRPAKTVEDLPDAVPSTPFEDDLARILRFACPECGTVLRQEAHLSTPQRPDWGDSHAQSGSQPGQALCPQCGTLVEITHSKLQEK
jgi:predicted RNA-binding Zn-ribbon protein involved in translation (DUF1610 family)